MCKGNKMTKLVYLKPRHLALAKTLCDESGEYLHCRLHRVAAATLLEISEKYRDP